jgi:hypothetical protein
LLDQEKLDPLRQLGSRATHRYYPLDSRKLSSIENPDPRYLASILPGLAEAELPVSRAAQLTPAAWVATN